MSIPCELSSWMVNIVCWTISNFFYREVLEEDREAVDVDGPPVQRQQLQQEHQRTSVMKVCLLA